MDACRFAAFELVAAAAPPNSTIRITNLDTADPPSVVLVESDGSFDASISAEPDDELRFQVRTEEERKPPIDLVYVGFEFAPPTRVDCFGVALETDLGATGVGMETAGTLTLENDCNDDAQISMVAFRTVQSTFAVDGEIPTAVPAGATADVGVAFAPGAAGETEAILLLRVTVGEDTARYPVTAFGVGQ